MSCVHAAFHGGVARIELDRPPLNVLDLAAAAELAEVLEDASLSRARPWAAAAS